MDMLDYIVVGQGIAGSCLGFELLERGYKIRIFDDSWRDAACLVAAGVVNPITGKRLVKSWRSAVAHPYAKKFYRNLERELGAEFFHDRKILQLCRSPEEQNLWLERSSLPEYAEFIGAAHSPDFFGQLDDSFGSYFIEHSAWVETRKAMDAFKKYFASRNILISEKFDYEKLDLSGDAVRYGGLSAKKIVFCEGWQVAENPFFSWLPYRPAKGEILTLKSDADIPPHIVHRGNWIMKCGDRQFRIGSTWDRENLNSVPTLAACAELLAAAPKIFRGEHTFEVVCHEAGVRPCTATTRPHLGKHPKDGRLLSFNGFGSKGYALSPYFAKHFCDWLEDKTELDKEADLSRHIKKFFT